MYYDADWRLLEERIDLDFDPEEELEESTIDQHTQYVWGERYIDDIVATRHDLDPEEENGADLTYFHVTDAQFSTVAMVLPIPSSPARVLERVTYSAYGVARHHRIADLNGDGAVDGADLGLFPGTSLSIDDVGYRSEADFDRNGANDGGDLGALLGDWGTALPAGDLSAPATRNRIGYCGYVFAPETRMYLARNRWLEPPLGRWVQRDPLGYVDGMNLYEYCMSDPVFSADSHGTHFYDGIARWDDARRARVRGVLGQNDPDCTPACCEVRMYATTAFGLSGQYHMCLEIETPTGASGACEVTLAELREAEPPTTSGTPSRRPVGTGPVGGLLGSVRSGASSTRGPSEDFARRQFGGTPDQAWGIYVEAAQRCRREAAKDAGRIVPPPGSSMSQCDLAECLVREARSIGGAANGVVGYDPLRRNSNSFIGEVIRKCGGTTTGGVETGRAPAFGNPFLGGGSNVP